MQARLKKYYYRSLLPAVGVIAVVLGGRALQVIGPVPLLHEKFWTAGVFVLTLVSAVAGPVALRAVFAHLMRGALYTPSKDFYRFQKCLIQMTLPAVYLISIVCLVELPRFWQAGIILSALYAVYYQYPSERRIASDQRVFRVEYGNHPCENKI